MATSVNVLSSKRSYEFRQDDIRLSLLSNRGVTEHIRQHFSFQFAEVRTPPDTFGPVPSTFPPGLVFALGISPYPENGASAIRSINVEPMRIVIDVASPSDILDPTFNELQRLVKDIRASDGAPAIGAPVRIEDYSELTAHLAFEPSALLPAHLRDIVTSGLSGEGEDQQVPRSSLPFVQIRMQSPELEYLGSGSPSDRFLQLDLRSHTLPSARIYYSGATLDSHAHVALLDRIENALEGQRQ
jgi:hypothetical protein